VLGPLSVKKNEERKKEVASLLADIVKYIEKGRLTSVTFRDLPEKGPLPSSEESITFEDWRKSIDQPTRKSTRTDQFDSKINGIAHVVNLFGRGD